MTQRRFPKPKLVHIASKGQGCRFPSPMLLATGWFRWTRWGGRAPSLSSELASSRPNPAVTAFSPPNPTSESSPNPAAGFFEPFSGSKNRGLNPRRSQLPCSPASSLSSDTNLLTKPISHRWGLEIFENRNLRCAEGSGKWEVGSEFRLQMLL